MPIPRAARTRISRRIKSERDAGVRPDIAKAIAYSEERRRGTRIPRRRANGFGDDWSQMVLGVRPRARRSNPAGITPYISTSKTGRILTREVERMEYIHAENGQPYKHLFRKGTSARVNDNGTVEIYRPDGKPSWEDYDPMLFLTNPPKHRHKGKRRGNAPRRGHRAKARHSNKPRKRARRPNAARRRTTHRAKHRTNAAPRTINRPRGKKRGRRHGSNPFAVTHQVHRVNKPRHKGRRGHRKNPPISSLPKLSLKALNLRVVGDYIVKGAQVGALTFAGRVATGYATALVDMIPGVGNNSAPVEMGLQFLASVVLGLGVGMVNPFAGVCVMGGGFEGVLDNFIQTYVPSVSTALQLSAGGAPSASTGAYARRVRTGAYARRVGTGGVPLNPAIPVAERKRGFAGYQSGTDYSRAAHGGNQPNVNG